MRARTTLFLILIVAALAAVILGIERYLPTTREMAEMKKGPVQFDPKKITLIEISSSGGDATSLSWDGAQWWVRHPFNDLADPEKIAKLLNELGSIGWINRVHREEFDDAGWAKTHLDQPRYTIKIQAGATQMVNANVGSASPIEGSHYISLLPTKKEQEAAQYLAKTLLPDLLKVTPEDWRDSKLLRLPADVISNLKLVQSNGQIELTRTKPDNGWMLTKPLNTRGSKEKIGELISTLLNLVIKDAADPSSSSQSPTLPQAAADISSQELKISVTIDGFQKPFELKLTKPVKGSIETKAQASYRKHLYTVTSKALNDLWAEPNDLRDIMLASIDKDTVSKLDITSALHPEIHLEKQSDSWFVQRNKRQMPANGDRVARFFEVLNTFKIIEFTADSASNLKQYGLENPFLTTTWTDGKSKPVKLLFGTNQESTDFFAKYDHEPSIYRIDASILPGIPQESIKWKGLGILRFTQFSLRQISLAAGTAPPVILKYDSTTAQWTGERAGQDITAQIDRVKADKLATSFAKFSVQDWAADATNAIIPLQSPALRVIVTLGDPGTNTGNTRDTIINFAPTQAGMDTTLYFGQIQGDPDVFYIARSSLLELLAPVFKTTP